MQVDVGTLKQTLLDLPSLGQVRLPEGSAVRAQVGLTWDFSGRTVTVATATATLRLRPRLRVGLGYGWPPCCREQPRPQKRGQALSCTTVRS